MTHDMNYRGECGREGMGRMEWSEGGGEWDNCNSIINKYIKKNNVNTRKLGHWNHLGGWLLQMVMKHRLDGVEFFGHIKGFNLHSKSNEKTWKNFKQGPATGLEIQGEDYSPSRV